MKMFSVLLIGAVLLVNFNPLLFAAELEDLKSEVQALREEVKTVQSLREEIKILREELKTVKKETPEAVAQKETVTQDDLQGVRAEVETLRDQWDRALKTKTAQTTRSLTFGGTVATRYTQTRDETAKSGFSLSSLILSFKGNLRRDYEFGRNLDYAFSLSSATTSDYKIAPLDAYLTYSPLPSLDLEKPRLTLALGQQKKPFGRDPQTTEEYKPTLRSAQFDTQLGLGTRDIGFIAKGDLFPVVDYGFKYRVPLVEYAFGVINGAGSNTTDNNNQKDFVGRIGINAPADYNSIFRGLSAGISGWTGQKSLSLSSGAITRRGHKNRWGYDLAYNRTPIGLTAEYAQGTDATLSGSAASPVLGAVKSDGYAVTAFYNFGQQFVKGFKGQNRYDDWYPLTYQPFVRFDSWDPNTHLGNDRINVTTLGFNWFFAETTKLQFNYNIVKKQDKSGSNGSGYNEFLAQFQYGF